MRRNLPAIERAWIRCKSPAKCRPCRGSEFGTLTRHGMPGSHHIVPRDAARTTGPHDRVGGRLPTRFLFSIWNFKKRGTRLARVAYYERDPVLLFLLAFDSSIRLFCFGNLRPFS